MNTGVTIHELEASADLRSLLAVCIFAAKRMATDDEDAAEMADDLARCLRWAKSLADQTHHAIQMAERIGRGARP